MNSFIKYTIGFSLFALVLGLPPIASSPVFAEPAPTSVKCYFEDRQTSCPDTDNVQNLSQYKANTCYTILASSSGIALSERTCAQDDTTRCFSDAAGQNEINCPSDISSVPGKCYYINSGDEFNGRSVNEISCANVGGGGRSDLLDEALPACAPDAAGNLAANEGGCQDSFTRCPVGSIDENGNKITAERYGVPTSDGQCLSFDPNNVPDLEDNPILIFMGRMITFLSAGIGIILTILVVVAGIRYTLARGNPQESAAAKSMIEKAAIAVIMYLFAFALINWLVPGGLLT